MSRQTAKSGGRTQASQSGGRRHAVLDNAAVDADIAGLETLDLEQLRARWIKVTGRSAPKSFRTKLLKRALAHEIQVAAYGGLSSALKRRLRLLCEAAREGRFEEVLGTSAIRPGTLLVRSWQGETHRVMATKDGFVWNGDSYGSLSTIARKITGTSWNGWTFFGVKNRRSAA